MYQGGVFLYHKKDYRAAEKKISEFIKKKPDSYWGYFILWKIRRDLDNTRQPDLLAKARYFAEEKKNLVFLDFLKKEIKD